MLFWGLEWGAVLHVSVYPVFGKQRNYQEGFPMLPAIARSEHGLIHNLNLLFGRSGESIIATTGSRLVFLAAPNSNQFFFRLILNA